MSHSKSIWIFTSGIVLFMLFQFPGCGNNSQETMKKVAILLKTELPPEQFISNIEIKIPELMEKAMIPGLSIAATRDGQIFWTGAFGVKNEETKMPVTDSTVFEAASLSKPVFAYAVLRVVERGVLDLDKHLIEYVTDEYIEKNYLGRKIDDERFRKITARMVLSHTPGFPNWRGQDPLKINFEPGEKFSYSGEGFGYLQRVVEKITEKPLNDFMTEQVFEPLGMMHSSYVWQKSYDHLSSDPHGLMTEVQKKGHPRRGHAAATLHTTAIDYAKFVCAIMNNSGLADSTIVNMLTPQIEAEPENSMDVSWGLGIGLEKTDSGQAFWHWGDNGNFKAFVLGFKKQKIGVVYFANSYYGLSIHQEIVDIAVGGNHPVFTSAILNGYGSCDSRAMEFIRILIHQGVDSSIQNYYKLTKDQPEKKIIKENELNQLGYQLLRLKRVADAIKIFKLNVEIYPESFNVYDSLGEAYIENGDKELAIENYKRSIELNPDNENGKMMLKKITG